MDEINPGIITAPVINDANQFYEIDNGTATSYFFRDDERITKQTAGSMEYTPDIHPQPLQSYH
ncbi:hypothetical protein Mpsy_3081 [Methanolobus psychrophilus R15]|nr:hypothetical protein Mpsy_3081 [Methanolobus psychrophilus R15]